MVSTFVERIRIERRRELVVSPAVVPDRYRDIPQALAGEILIFHVQHPSHNPAHGAFLGGPPVIHEERVECRSGDLTPLFAYLARLLPPATQ